MKNSTCRVSVVTDGQLLSTSVVPAIRGYEAVKELSYNYDSNSDKTSLEISSNRKIKNLEGLVASVINYGNPGDSNLSVVLSHPIGFLMSRRTVRYRMDSYGRSLN